MWKVGNQYLHTDGHMQNHETKLCDICSEYQPKKNFARHMANHDQMNKYFECNTCDANFNQTDELKRHMKIHEKAVDIMFMNTCLNILS